MTPHDCNESSLQEGGKCITSAGLDDGGWHSEAGQLVISYLVHICLSWSI